MPWLFNSTHASDCLCLWRRSLRPCFSPGVRGPLGFQKHFDLLGVGFPHGRFPYNCSYLPYLKFPRRSPRFPSQRSRLPKKVPSIVPSRIVSSDAKFQVFSSTGIPCFLVNGFWSILSHSLPNLRSSQYVAGAWFFCGGLTTKSPPCDSLFFLSSSRCFYFHIFWFLATTNKLDDLRFYELFGPVHKFDISSASISVVNLCSNILPEQ